MHCFVKRLVPPSALETKMLSVVQHRRPHQCVANMQRPSLEVSQSSITFQSLQSALHPLVYGGSLGNKATHSSLHRSRSCLRIGQLPWGTSGSYRTFKKTSLAENLSQKFWNLKKGLWNWLYPSNKSTAYISETTYVY